MKIFLLFALSVSFSLASIAQTYQGKIVNGSIASISISKSNNIVTASRQVLSNGANEGSKFVNLTGANVVNGKFEITGANKTWVIPFDPSIPPMEMIGGCYEYRCNCGAGCSPGGGGCEVLTIDGIASCRPVIGPDACSCCSGFLVRVKCGGAVESPVLNSSSFILIEANSVIY